MILETEKCPVAQRPDAALTKGSIFIVNVTHLLPCIECLQFTSILNSMFEEESPTALRY